MDKKYLLGGLVALLAIVVVGYWFFGNARYNAGRGEERAEWVHKLDTQPVKRDTQWVRDTIPSSPQYLTDSATLNWLDDEIDKNHELSDSLKGLYSDYVSLMGRYSLTANAHLIDSFGGVHNLSYNFDRKRFSEEYIPPPRIRDFLSIKERQEIPYEVRRIFVVGASFEYMGGPGYGVHFGVKPLRLGGTVFPTIEGVKWSARATFEWEF